MENTTDITIVVTTSPNRIETLWNEFEQLLLESIKRRQYEHTRNLLQHQKEVIEPLAITTRFHREETKPSAPLVFAAEHNYNEFLKLFLQYDYTIPVPHITNCQCATCQNDKLGEAINRMSVLRALSNPFWIGLTSADPFLTLFKLCQLNRKYGSQDDSFENRYEEQSEMNICLCLRLLDEVVSQGEGCVLMRHKSSKDRSVGADLTFVKLAMNYTQKEVISHPVSQHFVTSRVFDEIPGWKTSGIPYKIVLVFTLALMCPITTIVNITCPFKCCYSIANISMQPFVKFVNGAMSFIFFLALLAYMGATQRDGIRSGKSPILIEVLVFVWVLGFCLGELKQMYTRGILDYLSCGWNWIDIAMDFLMLSSYGIWIVLCFITQDHKLMSGFRKNLMDFSDGMFSIGIILSFIRVVYLCQITSYLGLLQLCLGKMVQVIFQFAFIMIVVLFSFAVAMVYLFRALHNYEEIHWKYENSTIDQTEIYKILNKTYDGLLPTIFTLVWSNFNMADTKTLKDFGDGSLIQLWANCLFTLHIGVSMIVLLNMLIAMMNNSYEKITNNLETEHKFSRTRLWMEYIGDEQTRPVPFNLIPTIPCIKEFFRSLKNCFERSLLVRMERDASPYSNELKKEYKELCSALLSRYTFNEFGYSYTDEIPPQPSLPVTDPFVHKLKTHILNWKAIGDKDLCSCGGGVPNLGYVDQGDVELFASDDVESEAPTSRTLTTPSLTISRKTSACRFYTNSQH